MAYSKQTWVTGETITASKLNHLEDGVAAVSANGAIGTANLADGAVTAAKLGESATDIVADTFSTSAAYSSGDYCIYSGALYRFSADKAAGSWDSTKVVAVALADDVSELESALTQNDILRFDYYDIGTWVENSYINSNVSIGATVDVTPVSNNSFTHVVVEVQKGDLLKVEGDGGNASRLWAFTDSAYKLISKASYNSGHHIENLTAPSDGYLIVNSSDGTSVIRYCKKYFSKSPIGETVSGKLDNGYYCLNDEVINNNWGFISIPDVGQTVDYTFTPDSNTHCGVFDVVNGDAFKITGSGGNAYRLWAFVDTNDVVLSKSKANLVADTPFIIIAPANGKLIYTSYYANLSIWKQAKDSTAVYQESIEQAEYDYRNRGLDVLSAFSHVSCFGDSLTASVVYTHDNGDGTHQVRSAYKKYPWILGQKIGAEAESVATGGYSATDWWNAYANRIEQKDNQLVIIYLGTNYGLTQTVDTDAVGDDYTQYANTNTGNYCKIVKKSLDVGAKVLLIKIHNGGGGNTFITNDAIDDIATRFNVAVVNVPMLYDRCYHAFPDNTGINEVHYNDLGYAAFAESLIRNVGALSSDMKIRLIPS